MPMRMGMARVIASMYIGISYLVGGPSWGVRPEKAPEGCRCHFGNLVQARR